MALPPLRLPENPGQPTRKVQELLDLIIGLGDNSEVQRDKELSALFQNKAEELFRLSGSTSLSTENQAFFRMAEQLISGGNKISVFVRRQLLDSGNSNSQRPELPVSIASNRAVSDVNTRNVGGNGEALTPLGVAARLGDVEAIRRLVAEGAQVDGQCTAYLSERDYYPYWITCDPNISQRKKPAAVGKLIPGWTPLKFAVYAGQLAAVQELIKLEANVNARDGQDQTILMLASALGFTEIVKELIQKGAEVNATGMRVSIFDPFKTDGKGKPLQGNPRIVTAKWTALHAAARLHHLETAVALLESGAEVNAKTAYGHVPLMYALGNVQLVLELLERKAEVNLRDGVSSLSKCHEFSNRKVLEQVGIDLNGGEETFWRRFDDDWVPITEGPRPAGHNSRKAVDTLLHHVVRGNHLVEAQFILQRMKKEDINNRGYAYLSPLRLAVYKAIASSGEEQDKTIAIMQLLLHSGADVEDEIHWYCPKMIMRIQENPKRIDKDIAPAQRTLLMHAAIAGAVKVMRVLLIYKAKVHLKTMDLRMATPQDKLFYTNPHPSARPYELPCKVVQFQTNIVALASKYAPVEAREEVKKLLLAHGASGQAPDYTAIPETESDVNSFGRPSRDTCVLS